MASDEQNPASAVRSDLQRLIEALDRRVPHLERVGETAIAADAAELRARALLLIREIDGRAAKS